MYFWNNWPTDLVKPPNLSKHLRKNARNQNNWTADAPSNKMQSRLIWCSCKFLFFRTWGVTRWPSSPQEKGWIVGGSFWPILQESFNDVRPTPTLKQNCCTRKWFCSDLPRQFDLVPRVSSSRLIWCSCKDSSFFSNLGCDEVTFFPTPNRLIARSLNSLQEFFQALPSLARFIPWRR